MTLDVSSDGYLLDAGEGDHLWFADSLVSFKATKEQTRGGLTVAEVTAPRGAASPLHRHHHEDEAWYVLDGQLTFWLADQERTATAGAFVFGPRLVEHGFQVDSAEAHFLLLLTPAGFEDFARASGWAATARTFPPAGLPPHDAHVLAAAVRAHGLDLIQARPSTVMRQAGRVGARPETGAPAGATRRRASAMSS